ncbi:MAG TPA: efflux RND transporter periplasmic adaptor subunit, partial [Vicinamibacterales bacterium]|nr:efflux RND transporter periplasmic adaptor subunit [Vicinamibacterales bacterium]
RSGVEVIPLVEVVQLRTGRLPLFERLTGTVRASGEVAIYPQAAGSVVEVLAQNGDAVRKGQPLVRIQLVGSEAQLEQAKSALAAARAAHAEAQATLRQLEQQYERNAALGREGLVPEDTVVTLRAQVEAARAAEARARAQVQVAEATIAERADVQQQTVIRAPIAGLVGQRNAEVGMRVDDQTALFVIGQLDTVRVEVPVTQEILSHLEEGQRVEIHAPGGSIAASVSRISPFLAAGSYTAEVEVDVPNTDRRLVPGMFVTVDIYYGESEEATLAPVSALYEHPLTGERGIYVSARPPSDPARAPGAQAPDPVPMEFRRVDVVAEGPETVGIRGLAPGTWVVVIGQHLLAQQAGEGPPQGRIQAISWERILELQRLQRDDLLRQFMEKQQRLAVRGVRTR